jgi:hypothetical protein
VIGLKFMKRVSFILALAVALASLMIAAAVASAEYRVYCNYCRIAEDRYTSTDNPHTVYRNQLYSTNEVRIGIFEARLGDSPSQYDYVYQRLGPGYVTVNHPNNNNSFSACYNGSQHNGAITAHCNTNFRDGS